MFILTVTPVSLLNVLQYMPSRQIYRMKVNKFKHTLFARSSDNYWCKLTHKSCHVFNSSSHKKSRVKKCMQIKVFSFNSFAAKQHSTRLFSLADKQVQASNLREILNVDIPAILDHIREGDRLQTVVVHSR